MASLSRVASAAVAMLALAALLFGVPAALWILVQPLITTWTTSPVPITQLLVRPDDGTVLLTFLAFVAAAAWLVLAVSIVAELATAFLHRQVLRIDLPGFRWGRGIAAGLIAAALGTGPAMAAPASPVATIAITSTALPAANVGETPSSEKSYTVVPHDSLWRIAEATLGNPLRWREIYDLNVGRPQHDGGMLTEGSLLDVGWHLRLPADAREIIHVAPGDTMSGLAAQHLGDAARAPELFAANAGRPEPRGGALTDPDLIRPGWTLEVPTVAPAPPGAGSTDDNAPAVPGPAAPPAPPPARPPATTPIAPAPGPTRSAPIATPPPTSAAPESEQTTVAALGISALVVGGFVTALAIRRRRQMRLRLFHHKIAVPDDEAGRVEWSAVHDAPDLSITHLDLALRSLAYADFAGIAVPRIRAVRLTAMDGLISLVSRASLPPPFVPVGDEDDWTLDADEPLPVPSDDAAGRCAPFPALISVATDAERTLLVDLEQRGVLRLGGNRARTTALLRHIAAELATSPMAEDVEVILIGFGEDLDALEPDRLRLTPDLGTALAEIEHRSRTARTMAEQHDLDGIIRGRLLDIAADAWLPTILLVDQEPGADDRVRIDAIAALPPGTVPVAVVLVDDGRAELTVDDDGLLHLPDIHDGPWCAAQLTDRAGTHLSTVLAATDRPSAPPGPATGPEAWTHGMSEDGSLSRSGVGDDHDSPTGPDEPTSDADPAARRRLAVVDHQDPDLDEDLQRWHDDAPPTIPLISILGEPTVRSPGQAPTTRPHWFAEVLIYLSLHPAGVSTAKAADDLWPDGHRISPATIRHAFFGARRWAGHGYNGDPDATFVSDMHHDTTYRLRGHLLDWDIFRRLRKRAQARHDAHHPGAVADYEAALDLIRGPVLSGLRPGGYAWLNNHDQRHDLQIPCYIVDAAHELVDIALAAGDISCARRAAERARAVDIDVVFDRPLTDLMRVAHAEDNLAEVELCAAILLDARGFDVPEDLAPDSFAVLNDLLPSGSRGPRP